MFVLLSTIQVLVVIFEDGTMMHVKLCNSTIFIVGCGKYQVQAPKSSSSTLDRTAQETEGFIVLEVNNMHIAIHLEGSTTNKEKDCYNSRLTIARQHSITRGLDGNRRMRLTIAFYYMMVTTQQREWL